MPDPENSADDEMNAAERAFWASIVMNQDQLRRVDLSLAKAAFQHGWRAAMAEVRKEREHVEAIVRQERAEDVAWDRRQV